jgi:hypothetical protein
MALAACGDSGTEAGAPAEPVQVDAIEASEIVVSPGLGELESIALDAPAQEEAGEIEDSSGRSSSRRRVPAPEPDLDPVIDRGPEQSQLTGPAAAFEGIAFDGDIAICCPSDAVGDIGADHYLEWVNTGLQVFSRTGEPVSPLLPGNTIFAALGASSECALYNRGDPVVAYDQFAERWVVTQFAFPLEDGRPVGPSYSCVAVSRTSNPALEENAWCVAVYKYSDTDFYDYPKLGVWRDAYTLTALVPGLEGSVSQLVLIEREPLLDCEGTPRALRWLDDTRFRAIWLPADVDGATPPDEDQPPLFVTFLDDKWSWSPYEEDVLLLAEMTPDFDAGTAGVEFQEIPVAPFDSNLCEYVFFDCLLVPDFAPRLDAISDRLMNRAAYRRLDGYDALALTHTVDIDGDENAGIRWYELRDSGDGFEIASQGTFAPNDGNARWLGSAAIDAAGNLAVVYALAGRNAYPSVRYAARLADDPPGKLGLGEGTLIEGAGVQLAQGNRWGDYGALTVDPLDDCTFWYAGQHYPETSDYGWATRVVSFRLPGCPP